MVDTPKATAAKIEAVAKDVVGRSGDATNNIIEKNEALAKDGVRRGAEAVRGMARKTEENVHVVENTASEGIRTASEGMRQTSEGLRAVTTEVPAAMRDAAERGVTQMKDAYSRLRKVAEETNGLVEESYTTTTRGLTELQVKMLETAKQNTGAMFDHARDLMNVRSLAEAVELQTAFVRRQFESFTAQAKDVTTLATRLGTEAARPVRVGIERSVETFRHSA